MKISFENHVYFGRKISEKIFSKDCAFNDYLLFELMQNIEAKRYLERSFYTDKTKRKIFTWFRRPNRVCKGFRKILFFKFSFLGKTRFAQFYLRKENTLFSGECTRLKIGFHIEENCVSFQKEKT